MTEIERAGAGSAYSKDYWDIVFEQLAKRRMFKIALAVLAVLYGLAIYAPYLAGDRPYVLSAVDYTAYEKARKSLYPVTLGLRKRLKQMPEQFLEQRLEGSTQTFEESLRSEQSALATRIDTLRLYAPAESHASLDEFQAAIAGAVEANLGGDLEGAATQADALKDQAKEVRSAFAARLPDAEGDEGLVLAPATTYPLFEATTYFEVFFMALWAFVLTWPLWNKLLNRGVLAGDRERIRRWRKRKVWGVLGISVLAALGWKLTVDGHMTFEASNLKAKLTSGEMVAETVIFPPIPFGFAETHLAEKYRPPTWKDYAEISEEGYYTTGARVPKRDEVTGFMPEPTPVDVRWEEPALNSGWRHPLGTDSLGRDLVVRALWGARVSLAVGIVSTAILMVIGVIMGSLAGYFGGRIDIAISRFIEIVLCFPVFFLILVIVAFIGPSILNIMLVIGFVRWTGVARLARGEFLRAKELEFVVAARAMGCSTRRIVFRHMLPNALGPLLVAGTFSVAAGILVESTLSFLGFGIQLPIPSWGALIVESRQFEHWWIMVYPGVLIFITVLCYNLVGDAIRDAMDPRLKH
jgi:peptide/nickel transport system permease protein